LKNALRWTKRWFVNWLPSVNKDAMKYWFYFINTHK
jgi:hypothetical protein